MKKFFVLASLILSSCLVYAQEELSSITKSVENLASQVEQIGLIVSQMSNQQVTGDSVAKKTELFVPLQPKHKRHHIYATLDLSSALSLDRAKLDDNNMMTTDTENNSSTGFGLEFGSTIVFVPGTPQGNMLKINPLGFAYSTGVITSFHKSDRYDTTCDFLHKVGAEIGNGHKVGFGFDFLWGYGKSAGDMYIYASGVVNSDTPDKVCPYTDWCWKYGGQVWFRPLSIKKGLDVLTYARLIIAKDTGMIKPFSAFHINKWKKENWAFGVLVRYTI